MDATKRPRWQQRFIDRLDLEPDEEINGLWTGGRAWGNRSNLTKIGGVLFVTNRRIAFRSISVPVETAGGVDDISHGQYHFEYGVSDVFGAEVDPTRRAGLTIRTRHDDIGMNISHKPTATIFSRKNKVAVNEAVAAINLAVENA